MGISFGSINSGLPKDIVQQIMKAEKLPLAKLEERKEKINSKKSLLDDLAKRVENLRGKIFANKSERSFRELQVNVSGDQLVATADKNIAQPGSHQIEVIQLAQKSSAISNGVEDKDNTYLGVGYIQYELPNGEERSVYIDSEHSSLSGIAKLINGDTENGMTAKVINSGDDSDEPWKLIISLENTGDGHRAEFPNLYLVDGMVDLYFDAEREARDAKVKVDGFEVELPSNKTSELIPGLTIDLKKAKPGEEITIDISEDTVKIGEKVTDLVDSINEVISFIKEQNQLDENTDTSRTLGGDLTLQTIESRLRTAVFQTIQTEFGARRVGDIGISFQRTGLLALDTNKLQSKLEENFAEVAQIITGRYSLEEGKVKGFIDNLESVAEGALSRPAGTISSRRDGLNTQIDQIDRRIERKNRHLEKKEQALKAKFARLEETISRIQTQGSGLAGMGGGVNPVTQLG